MKIKNWSTWQTYRKDRGTPPWIKVYRNLFSNPEWSALTDSEKGQLVSIWILASDKAGVIPNSPQILKKLCMLDDAPNVNKFIELGFLVGDRLPDGDQVVTRCQQHDAPETETETETLPGKPDDTSKKYLAIAVKVIAYLNTVASKRFRTVDTNTKFIMARLKEGHSENDLMWVIDKKVDDWLTDPDMNQYLRPATLFNAEKFNQYIGEKGVTRPMSEKEQFYNRIRGDSPADTTIIEGEYNAVE